MTSTGERILVVENDPDISEFIARQALRPLGHDVRAVDQAAKAIEDALRNPPDLILANLDLPDLGGKDILAALSAQGVTAPLVVIVAKGDEKRAIEAFRLGAADALLWPAKDTEVVRVVERALQPTRSRRIRRELYHQLETAQEALRRRTSELTAILSASRELGAGTNQRQFFDQLLEITVDIAGADAAWFLVRDHSTGHYLLRAQRNLPPTWARKLDQSLDDGLSALVIRSGRALTIHGQPLEKFKVSGLGRSAAVVPVKRRNDVLGTLVAVRKADAQISSSVQNVLGVLADFAAISLLGGQLYVALEASSAAARRTEKARKSLLYSLQTSIDRLRSLQSGEAGALTQAQKSALTAIQVSLEQSADIARHQSAANPRPED